MKVAVGSTNPVKLRAARKVLRRVFPRARLIALEVPSGVAGQPIGDAETRAGAVNRARAAQREGDADFGIGLEGGIVTNEFGTFTCAWCAIVDRAGRVGVGGSANMWLPDSVAARVRNGAELGDAMDAFAGIQDVKYKMGAIGVLTKGLTNRQEAYEFIVKLALARFLWEGA